MDYIQNSEFTKGFLNLETRLAESLKPVHPNQAFINNLKDKLAQGTSTIVETRSNHNSYIFVGLGLMTGALIIWLLKRMKKI